MVKPPKKKVAKLLKKKVAKRLKKKVAKLLKKKVAKRLKKKVAKLLKKKVARQAEEEGGEATEEEGGEATEEEGGEATEEEEGGEAAEEEGGEATEEEGGEAAEEEGGEATEEEGGEATEEEGGEATEEEGGEATEEEGGEAAEEEGGEATEEEGGEATEEEGGEATEEEGGEGGPMVDSCAGMCGSSDGVPTSDGDECFCDELSFAFGDSCADVCDVCSDTFLIECAGDVVDLIATLAAKGNHTTLISAIDVAGLTGTLTNDGPFTLFAPTDAAFDALGEAALLALIADQAAVADVLLYHVLEGQVSANTAIEAASAGTPVPTLQGSGLSLALVGDDLVINGVATVVETDVVGSNGVIHVIDAVLTPQTAEPVCGDGTCNGSEDTGSCPQDCGCPTPGESFSEATGQCEAISSPCCQPQNAVGCGADASCEEAVCNSGPDGEFCCSFGWDQVCANLAKELCNCF